MVGDEKVATRQEGERKTPEDRHDPRKLIQGSMTVANHA